MIPTEQQRRAIEMRGKTLAVIAGPGSGKTETLAERILADQHQGAHPAQQIAITFTNNAGDELRSRLALKGARPPQHTGTLHSWAYRCLRELPTTRPAYRDFKVVNDRQYEDRIKETLKQLGRKDPVSKARELAMTTGGTAGNAMVLSLAIRRAMLREKELHADLMLAFFCAELERDSPAFEDLMIYVDEYQDTAGIDAQIYNLLRARHNAHFYAVGDWRQAIYGFRGASPIHFEQLIAYADDTAQLTANFRSGPTICNTAGRLARGMPVFGFGPIEITSAGPIQDDTLTSQHYATSEEEALAIPEWIAQREKTIAILTRYNQGVSLIAAVLRAHGIPVQASTDRTEIVDQAASLPVDHLIHQDHRTEREWKSELARAGAPLAVQDALGARLAGTTTPEQRVAILSANEDQPDRDRVWVSTIHAAKGLEWDAVWIAGLDDQAFRRKIAEDHCLAFVAVTRARSHLKLTSARSRQSHRRETDLNPTALDLWPSA